MCFSSQISFGAGAVLLVTGAAAISKVKKPQEIMFASVPILFGLQQLTEGMLWLALTYTEFAVWRQPATTIFLFIAQVLWPLWVPLCLLLIERERNRKRDLYILTVIGLLLSAFLSFRLFYFGAEAFIIQHHIYYRFNYIFENQAIFSVIYIITTIFAIFFSGVKRMKILGVAVFLSFLFSQIFYTQFLISVWCFFAAAMSVIIYWVLAGIHKPVLSIRHLSYHPA